MCTHSCIFLANIGSPKQPKMNPPPPTFTDRFRDSFGSTSGTSTSDTSTIDEQEKRILNDSGMSDAQKKRTIESRRKSLEKKRKSLMRLTPAAYNDFNPMFKYDEDVPSKPAVLGGKNNRIDPSQTSRFNSPVLGAAAPSDNSLFSGLCRDVYSGDCNVSAEQRREFVIHGKSDSSTYHHPNTAYGTKKFEGDESKSEGSKNKSASATTTTDKKSASAGDASYSIYLDPKRVKVSGRCSIGGFSFSMKNWSKVSQTTVVFFLASLLVNRMFSTPAPHLFLTGSLLLGQDGKRAQGPCTCSRQKGSKGVCKAAATVDLITGLATYNGMPHALACYTKQCVDLPSSLRSEVTAPDLVQEGKIWVDQRAAGTADVPEKIWDDYCNHFKAIHKHYQGLKKDQVKSRISAIRKQELGADALQKVASMFGGSKSTAFLQFISHFPDKKQFQNCLGFAAPELMDLLKYDGVHVFFDATFKCVPKPFKQLMIIMVFDPVLKIYVPVFYILMTGKTDLCYHQTFL